MPIYEYECCDCSFRFEMRHGFHEEPQALCPKCQGQSRRVFQSTPIIFKGSGFYVTDHRKNHDSGAAQEKSEASQGEKGK